MCFSASASFSLAAVTAGIGGATLRHTSRPQCWPLALVPLLFSAQQVFEGVLWLQLDGAKDATAIAALSFAFLTFAKVIWPAYIATAMVLVEPDRRRRVILYVLAMMGLGLSADLLMELIRHPALATVRGHSIAYVSAVSGAAAPSLSGLLEDALPYLICTALPPLVSSHRAIRIFGAVILAGFAVTASAYLGAFVSVWCFFAAAASTVLYFFFRRRAFALPVHHAR
jgi:hypothetical protein